MFCVTACASFAVTVAAVNVRRHSTWQTALGAVSIIALVCWVVLGILETHHYRQFIPGKLQVLGPVFIDSNETLGTLIGAMLIRPHRHLAANGQARTACGRASCENPGVGAVRPASRAIKQERTSS
jgi:hypothetical protein